MKLLAIALIALAPVATPAGFTDEPADLVEILAVEVQEKVPMCCCSMGSGFEAFRFTEGAAHKRIGFKVIENGRFECFVAVPGSERGFVPVGKAFGGGTHGTYWVLGERPGTGLVFWRNEDGTYSWSVWKDEEKVGEGKAIRD